jgi:hypothetical protein
MTRQEDTVHAVPDASRTMNSPCIRAHKPILPGEPSYLPCTPTCCLGHPAQDKMGSKSGWDVGIATGSTQHDCLMAPEEVRAAMLSCWHTPASLQALIETFTAGCSHHHLCQGVDLVLSAAILLIAGLSHPRRAVQAGCAHLMRYVPHYIRISLLPMLIWRLQQPIGGGKAILPSNASHASLRGVAKRHPEGEGSNLGDKCTLGPVLSKEFRPCMRAHKSAVLPAGVSSHCQNASPRAAEDLHLQVAAANIRAPHPLSTEPCKSRGASAAARPDVAAHMCDESCGVVYAVPHVDAVREMIDALPLPCESLCVPVALLKADESTWRNPEVFGLVLETLECVRVAFCARLTAHVNLAKQIEPEPCPAAGNSSQGLGNLSRGTLPVTMPGIGHPHGGPGCHVSDIGMAFWLPVHSTTSCSFVD